MADGDVRVLTRRETAVRTLVRAATPVRSLVRSDGPAGPPGPPGSGGGGGGPSTIGDVTGLQAALDALAAANASEAATRAAADATKAPLASPALTGTPTAPTAAPGTNTVQVATTAFVAAVKAALVNGAPGALDTLAELAAAIGNDPAFAATIAAALALKADEAHVDDVEDASIAADVALDGRVDALEDVVNATAPSIGQHDALPGTSGTPSSTNKYVTNADSRLSDTRTPTDNTVGTTKLVNNAVTDAKLADMPVDTIKGRATAGTGDPENIACTAAGRALLDDSDAAAQRSTLGLGTVATQNVAMSGDLAGNYPSPTVAALHETGGPTKLTLGAIADGEFVKRVGSGLQGATPAGGSSDVEVFAFAFGFGE